MANNKLPPELVEALEHLSKAGWEGQRDPEKVARALGLSGGRSLYPSYEEQRKYLPQPRFTIEHPSGLRELVSGWVPEPERFTISREVVSSSCADWDSQAQATPLADLQAAIAKIEEFQRKALEELFTKATPKAVVEGASLDGVKAALYGESPIKHSYRIVASSSHAAEFVRQQLDELRDYAQEWERRQPNPWEGVPVHVSEFVPDGKVLMLYEGDRFVDGGIPWETRPWDYRPVQSIQWQVPPKPQPTRRRIKARRLAEAVRRALA